MIKYFIYLSTFASILYSCNSKEIEPEITKIDKSPNCQIKIEQFNYANGGISTRENFFDKNHNLEKSIDKSPEGKIEKITTIINTYNQDNRLINSLTTEDLIIVKIISSTDYEYHPNGKIKSKKYMTGNGKKIDLDTYNDKGSVLSRTTLLNGLTDFEYIYSYDSSNHLIKIEYKQRNILSSITTYEYQSGQKTNYQFENLKSGVKSSIKYSYNNKYQLVKEENSNGSTLEMEYGSDGKLNLVRLFINKVLISTTKHTYDLSSKLEVTNISTDSKNFRVLSEIKYQDNGKRRSYIYYIDKTKNSFLFKIEYDEFGNETNVVQNMQDGSPMYTIKKSYECV